MNRKFRSKRRFTTGMTIVLFAVAATTMAHGGLKDWADTLPEEILRQTFRIRTPAGTGTTFTVEVDERQYIVTAHHLLGTTSPLMVEIQDSETGWRELPVTVIGMEGPPVDVAVLATDSMLGSRSGVPVGVGTVGYGQEVRFLGYPLGLTFAPVPGFREAPLPFIKAGILSSLKHNEAGFLHLLVDATGNQGFSGGPLVLPRSKKDGESIDWHIAGVVTNVEIEPFAVKDESGAVVGWFGTNAGIVHAISIDAVTRILGYPFNRTTAVSWGHGTPARRRALPEIGGRVPGLVPER